MNPLIISEFGSDFDTSSEKISLALSSESPLPISFSPQGVTIAGPKIETVPDFWSGPSGGDVSSAIARTGRVSVGTNADLCPLLVASPAPNAVGLCVQGIARHAPYGSGTNKIGDPGLTDRTRSGYVLGFSNDGYLMEVASEDVGAASGGVKVAVGGPTAAITVQISGFFFTVVPATSPGTNRTLTAGMMFGTGYSVEMFRTTFTQAGALQTQNFNGLVLTQNRFVIDTIAAGSGSVTRVLMTPTNPNDARWIECTVWIPTPDKTVLSARHLTS